MLSTIYVYYSNIVTHNVFNIQIVLYISYLKLTKVVWELQYNSSSLLFLSQMTRLVWEVQYKDSILLFLSQINRASLGDTKLSPYTKRKRPSFL